MRSPTAVDSAHRVINFPFRLFNYCPIHEEERIGNGKRPATSYWTPERQRDMDRGWKGSHEEHDEVEEERSRFVVKSLPHSQHFTRIVQIQSFEVHLTRFDQCLLIDLVVRHVVHRIGDHIERRILVKEFFCRKNGANGTNWMSRKKISGSRIRNRGPKCVPNC